MRRLAATGLAAALLAGGAMAQTTAPAGRSAVTPSNSSNAPIDISAEQNEVHQPQRLVLYRGNVEAIQEQTRMRSPELRVFYKERQARSGQPKPAKASTAGESGGGQSSSIERIEALGPFYYVDSLHHQIAKSDHAVWLSDADTITLTGHVILTQDRDVTTGDKLVLNRRTGQHVLSMNNPGGANRVRAIIYPNQTQNAGATAPRGARP